MPIPASLVPNLPPLNPDGTYQPAREDFGIAQAPGHALGNFGNALGAVSHEMFQLAEADQQAKNLKDVVGSQNQIAFDGAEHINSLQSNPDPSTYVPLTKKFLAQQQASLNSQSMTPAVRQQVGIYFQQHSGQLLLQAQAQATRTNQSQAQDAVDTAIRRAITTGDPDVAASAIQHAKGVINISPEKEAAVMDEVHSKARDVQDARDAVEDPIRFLETHPVTSPRDRDPDQYQALRAKAMAARNQNASEQGKGALDAVYADQITTPEQVTAMTPQLTPSTREPILEVLNQRRNAEARAAAEDPANQKQVFAQFNELAGDYTPKLEGGDERWVQLASLAYQVAPGPYRDEMMRTLNQIRANYPREIKNAVDIAQRSVDAAHKAGLFGSGQYHANLGAIIDDGFVSHDNLVKEGFSEDQAKAISSLNEGDLEKQFKPFMGDQAGNIATQLSNRKNIEARTEAARLLYIHRLNESKSDPVGVATWQAIRDHKGPETNISWDAPGGKEASNERYADIKMGMAEWARLHPDAVNDPKQVQAEMYRLSAPGAMDANARAANSAPPADIRAILVQPGDGRAQEAAPDEGSPFDPGVLPDLDSPDDSIPPLLPLPTHTTRRHR